MPISFTTFQFCITHPSFSPSNDGVSSSSTGTRKREKLVPEAIRKHFLTKSLSGRVSFCNSHTHTGTHTHTHTQTQARVYDVLYDVHNMLPHISANSSVYCLADGLYQKALNHKLFSLYIH